MQLTNSGTNYEDTLPLLSAEEKARSLMHNRQLATQNRQRSLLSRAAAEIGLAL